MSKECKATRQDIARGLREHYERVSTKAHDWSNTIPKAIDAWEKQPELVKENDYFREHLAPFIDNLGDGSVSTCDKCGNLMDVVRPGKVQCAWCEQDTVTDLFEEENRRLKAMYEPDEEEFPEQLGGIPVRVMKPGEALIKENDKLNSKLREANKENAKLAEAYDGEREALRHYRMVMPENINLKAEVKRLKEEIESVKDEWLEERNWREDESIRLRKEISSLRKVLDVVVEARNDGLYEESLGIIDNEIFKQLDIRCGYTRKEYKNAPKDKDDDDE